MQLKFIDKIITEIRRKSRAEWENLAKEKFTSLRIWIQENGEKAAVLSLILGVIVVLFFKIIMILLVLCALGITLVWALALPSA